MKRPDAAKPVQGDNDAGCSDKVLQSKYPSVMAYLIDGKYDDGSTREVSALSVTVYDGLIAIALNDKDLKQSLYTRAETLAEALGLMEGAIKGGQGEWRPWKSGKRK